MAPKACRFLFGVFALAAAGCQSHATCRSETARQPSTERPVSPAAKRAASSASATPTPNATVTVPRPLEPVPPQPEAPGPPDHDPHLLERLTISVPEPKSLADWKFRAARGVFREVTRAVAAGSYGQDKDPRCQQALVSDKKGMVRGFTQLGGTEHHHAEFRHYFDQDGALRLILHRRNDEGGGSTEDIIAFDPAGDVVGCKHVEHHPEMPAPDFCADEEPEPHLDPEVKKSLKPSAPHRPRNSMRERLQSVDPTSEFKRCDRS